MRGRFLRHVCGDLDPRERIILSLVALAVTAWRGSWRRDIVQIVVAVDVRAAGDGGLHLGVVCACEDAAACPGGPGGPAAVAVAGGGEDVREEFGEEGACTGEGCADDGDVALDGGPGCCADVGVCLISEVRRRSEVAGLGGGEDSQVGSSELEMTRRLCRRRMLVIMTL